MCRVRNKLSILVMLLGVLYGWPESLAAASDDLDNVTILTAPEVREQVTAGDALFVHVLSNVEYHIQHIPGSINIPIDTIPTSALMPGDKDTPIIFYCNGEACPYSRRASITAVELGYTHVLWFRGGIMEWRKYGYDLAVNQDLMKIKVRKLAPEDVQKLAGQDILILDVRPKWWRESENKSGVIEGTQMMLPLMALDKNLHRLPKDRPILLSDRLMRQSVHAAKYLLSEGFNVIGVVKGGSDRWTREGYPLLDESEEPPMIGFGQ